MCKRFTPTKLHIDAVVNIGLIEVDTSGMWECECDGYDCECESYDLEGYDMDELLREQAAGFLKADFDDAILAVLVASHEEINATVDPEADALRHKAHEAIWQMIYDKRATAKMLRAA